MAQTYIITLITSLIMIAPNGAYFAGPTPATWDDAEAYCESQGTTLASIHSEQDREEATTVCEATGDTWGCHIGLRKASSNAPWEWVDGSATDYGFINGDGTQVAVPPWYSTAGGDGANNELCGYIYDGTDPMTFEDIACDGGTMAHYHLNPPLCNGDSGTPATPSPVRTRRRKEVQVDISCDTVKGDTVLGAGDISRAKCPKRTTLVSCGIDGWHNIGGTRVRPAKDGVCEAELSEAVTSTQQYGVAAVANCCRFPLAADAEAITKLSDSGRKVQAECPNPSSLTGCTVDYESGSTNNIKGSFAGKAVIAKVERPTRNTCTGQAKNGKTDVVAGAQCIKLNNNKYSLDCMAVTKYGTRSDMTEANTCPMDYQLLSCMTYTTTLTLDDWHLLSGPVCYVQQDNYDEQYANGVCCKLTKRVIVDDQGEEVDEFEVDPSQEMFVENGVAAEMEEIIGNNMALIGSVGLIVFLLVVGYGFYRWCYGNDGGYKKLSTSEDDALLRKVQVY